MTTDPKLNRNTASPNPDPASESFQLTPGWLLVGLLAVVIGIGCGLVMSSATFLK